MLIQLATVMLIQLDAVNAVMLIQLDAVNAVRLIRLDTANVVRLIFLYAVRLIFTLCNVNLVNVNLYYR